MAEETTQAAAVVETPDVADPVGAAFDAWEAAQPAVQDEGETAESDAEGSDEVEDMISELAELESSEGEEVEEPAPELSQEAQDLAAALGDAPAGTDTLFRVLKENNPKLEAHFRNLQKLYTQSRDPNLVPPEVKALQEKVDALTARLEKPQAAPEETDEDDLGIDEEQMATFEKVAKKLGFVKADDLEAKETAKATTEQQARRQGLIRSANKEAVEAYGTDFAVLDEKTGDIAVDAQGIPKSPYAADLAAKLAEINARGTITWGELYHLARSKDLETAAYERGKAEGIAEITGEKVERVRKRSGAVTVSSSRIVAASPRIRYVPGETKREDVEKQALAKGFAAAGLA